MFYYEVAPRIIARLDKSSFTYHFDTELSVGQLVNISIGKKNCTGLVVASSLKPSYKTKPINSILAAPILPKSLVDTMLWMSDYYVTHLATVLQTCLPRGVEKTRRGKLKTQTTSVRKRTNFVLNAQQQAAIESIGNSDSGTILLHGVTGSGKTAVYIEAAKLQHRLAKSSIILVPEIALTSQLVSEFMNHFSKVLVTHSRQTEAERHTVWQQAAESSEPTIVIGPRSALFMPLQNLGLIIVDEAHEPSYKQDQAPRYSALRVATVLAQKTNIVCVFGSATPALTDYYLAEQASRPIINLTEPIKTKSSGGKPVVVDMKQKNLFKKHSFFSDLLLNSIEQALTNKKQVLLFHNRRGSASTTLCESCGWSAMCERCFVPYTLHTDKHRLLCHICGNQHKIPTSCPVCMNTKIIHKGIGTKRIEQEINKLFPGAVVGRFDADSAKDETVDSRYDDLYSGAINIIIGTQVIAKGLDLPHLNVVGIIQADAGLSLPDYSSEERTFQLTTQAIGRVREFSENSKIILQTYQPEHPAISFSVDQDYSSFYSHGLLERQRAKFPPFVYLLKLTCIYKTEASVVKQSANHAKFLRQKYGEKAQIMNPVPEFYERKNDSYRWQIIVKAKRRAVLVDIMGDTPKTHWQATLDPHSLL